jgi:hypothetical protein
LGIDAGQRSRPLLIRYGSIQYPTQPTAWRQ